ncbi:MAG: hypothetical protein SGI84_03415 [Gemmatimonadota bacterium]|nr:hypothetical protein [Gemmatimonadota bacterium]
MRPRLLLLTSITLATAGCLEAGIFDPGLGPDSPRNLTYYLDPVGTGTAHNGILLRWDYDTDPSIDLWYIYARVGTGNFQVIGSTISPSFHESAVPAAEYFVSAVDIDGNESPRSNIVVVDSRLTLAHPTTLRTVSLDGGIALYWSDNAYQQDPDGFRNYRVYSTGYDLDADRCLNGWRLEGTTVAPEFHAGALPNGSPRCFGVSAVSIEGWESLWSPVGQDTPRPESRNVVLTARQFASGSAGFRFWRDQNNDGLAQRSELGLVGSGNASDIDFSVERDQSGSLILTPIRNGVRLRAWTNGPVADLTEVDYAPLSGFGRMPLPALPGWGYVWETPGVPLVRFGAVRVTHVGHDFLILDWAFQTDPGNPELGPPGQ